MRIVAYQKYIKPPKIGKIKKQYTSQISLKFELQGPYSILDFSTKFSEKSSLPPQIDHKPNLWYITCLLYYFTTILPSWAFSQYTCPFEHLHKTLVLLGLFIANHFQIYKQIIIIIITFIDSYHQLHHVLLSQFHNNKTQIYSQVNKFTFSITYTAITTKIKKK